MTSPKDPDAALWAQVTQNVTPLRKPRITTAPSRRPVITPRPASVTPPAGKPIGPLTSQPLDTTWQKRLRRGRTDVDRSVDLHGMTQTQAHAQLMRTMEAAVRAEDRIVLVVTGKGAPKSGQTEGGRGVLRRMLPDWIETSPYAGHVFAIRPAHPVHGGSGAFYILLRRKRGA